MPSGGGANISSIGAMQTSIRSEQDLDDFMHGLLFNVGGPLLSQTGTDGLEEDFPENNFRICRWGSALTRLWEDCHHAVRVSRMNPAAVTGLGPAPLGNSSSFGQAIGHAIGVNLSAIGQHPPSAKDRQQEKTRPLVGSPKDVARYSSPGAQHSRTKVHVPALGRSQTWKIIQILSVASSNPSED